MFDAVSIGIIDQFMDLISKVSQLNKKCTLVSVCHSQANPLFRRLFGVRDIFLSNVAFSPHVICVL